jgi:hypothetical protein
MNLHTCSYNIHAYNVYSQKQARWKYTILHVFALLLSYFSVMCHARPTLFLGKVQRYVTFPKRYLVVTNSIATKHVLEQHSWYSLSLT